MLGNSRETSRSPDLPEGAICPCPGFCPEQGPGSLGFAPLPSLRRSVGTVLLSFVKRNRKPRMTQTSKATSRLKRKMENCRPRAAPRAVSSRGQGGNSDSMFPSCLVSAVARQVRGRALAQGWPGGTRLVQPGHGNAWPCHITRCGQHHASPKAGSVPSCFGEQEHGPGAGGRQGASLWAKIALQGCGCGLCHVARGNPPQRACWEWEGESALGGWGGRGGGQHPSSCQPRSWGERRGNFENALCV